MFKHGSKNFILSEKLDSKSQIPLNVRLLEDRSNLGIIECDICKNIPYECLRNIKYNKVLCEKCFSDRISGEDKKLFQDFLPDKGFDRILASLHFNCPFCIEKGKEKPHKGRESLIKHMEFCKFKKTEIIIQKCLLCKKYGLKWEMENHEICCNFLKENNVFDFNNESIDSIGNNNFKKILAQKNKIAYLFIEKNSCDLEILAHAKPKSIIKEKESKFI